MRHYIRISSAIVALVLAAGTTVSVAAQQAPRPAVIPVKVEVVVSRFQGDKKTSSLPFVLFVNANSGTPVSLRLGVDVPVGVSTVTAGNENSNQSRSSTTSTSSTTSHVDYRNVGTSIDCFAGQEADGRFSLNLRVQDSSLFTSETDGKMTLKVADPMAFRTFTFSNTLTMRDGQTLLWATGADKITGEVLKLEATLTVVK